MVYHPGIGSSATFSEVCHSTTTICSCIRDEVPLAGNVCTTLAGGI